MTRMCSSIVFIGGSLTFNLLWLSVSGCWFLYSQENLLMLSSIRFICYAVGKKKQP